MATLFLGEDPDGLGSVAGFHRDAQHIAEGMRLVGRHHKDTLAVQPGLHRRRGSQRRLADTSLADEEANAARLVGILRSGGGFHSTSTRFFRSLRAVSVNRRSALRLSSPIIGTVRSTESS